VEEQLDHVELVGKDVERKYVELMLVFAHLYHTLDILRAEHAKVAPDQDPFWR
jgi:hypothetical protein